MADEAQEALSATLTTDGGAADSRAPGSAADIEFLSALAEGGMGRVMLARQRSLRREVAVKVVKPEVTSPGAVTGLLEEAVLSGSLEHPNIVPVYLLAQDESGLPMLVMKRVEGTSWATLVEQPDHPAWALYPGGGSDRLAAHLSILGSVCNALHYAHSRGVIHRDIKPANVMVGAFGEVYLVDWGIAEPIGGPLPGKVADATITVRGRAPSASGIVGTPGFMAPEMAQGKPADVRTDVYLLGATLHYVLTRTHRHCGGDLLNTLAAARASAPQSYGPDVPEELAHICNRATHADPAERFLSAQDFRDAIAEFLSHRGSIELSDAAQQRLGQLRALLRPREARLPAETSRLHELMTESLFSFHQSLRAWPGNPRARTGLRECLIAIIEYEIAHENLVRAQSLLEEVEGPPPDLVARVGALHRHVREREAREARLRAFERENDWSISSRQRAMFFVLMCAISILFWRYSVRDQRTAPHTIPPLTLALVMGGTLAVMSVIVVIFRKTLFATAVNRHTVIGILICVAGMVINRGLHALPAPSTAGIVSEDQVLAALGAAIAGLHLTRRLWAAVPIFLSGALLSRLFPLKAGSIFAMTATLSLAVALASSHFLSKEKGRRTASVPSNQSDG